MDRKTVSFQKKNVFHHHTLMNELLKFNYYTAKTIWDVRKLNYTFLAEFHLLTFCNYYATKCVTLLYLKSFLLIYELFIDLIFTKNAMFYPNFKTRRR